MRNRWLKKKSEGSHEGQWKIKSKILSRFVVADQCVGSWPQVFDAWALFFCDCDAVSRLYKPIQVADEGSAASNDHRKPDKSDLA